MKDLVASGFKMETLAGRFGYKGDNNGTLTTMTYSDVEELL